MGTGASLLSDDRLTAAEKAAPARAISAAAHAASEAEAITDKPKTVTNNSEVLAATVELSVAGETGPEAVVEATTQAVLQSSENPMAE